MKSVGGMSRAMETLESRRLTSAAVRIPGVVAPTGMTRVGSTVYFFAKGQSLQGHQLWKTNGTKTGTVQVTTTLPQNYPYMAREVTSIVPLGEKIFFIDNNTLWSSDGTAKGTVALSKFSATVGDLAATDQAVFFSVTYPNLAQELWAYDTVSKTHLVKQIRGKGSDVLILSPAAVGSTLYFGGWDADHGQELWRTNGTPGGTALVKDLNPGTANSQPGGLKAVGDRLYFLGTGSEGFGLWSSDGTSEGTTEIHVVDQDTTIEIDEAIGTTLFFEEHTSATTLGARQAWRTEGTTATTQKVDASDRPAVPGVHYWFDRATTSSTLWRTDGTPAGTKAVTGGVQLYNVTQRVGGKFFFAASAEDGGDDLLWQSDGTAAGTYSLSGASTPPYDSHEVNTLFHDMLPLGRKLLVTTQTGYQKDGDLYVVDLSKAQITGQVFADANRNRVHDEGEAVYSKYVVYVDSNGNGKLDATEPKTVSARDGSYRFVNLKPGTYTVRIVASDRVAMTPTSYVLKMGSASSRNRDFGLVGPSIGGVVFNDANKNRVQDEGESPLIGFQLFLDLNNDGVKQKGEPASRTNGSGRYRFTDLLPGKYVVRQTPAPGWAATVPFYKLVVVAGQSAARHFANTAVPVAKAALSGIVYNDNNGDGFNPGEGSDQYVLYLDLNNNNTRDSNEPFGQTSTNRRYSFTDLLPGDYVMRVETPAGLKEPNPTFYKVTLAPGASIARYFRVSPLVG